MRRALIAACVLAALTEASAPEPVSWRDVAPGIELAQCKLEAPSAVGDSTVVLVRVDAGQWELQFHCLSEGMRSSGMTAREWCEDRHLVAAINAGMFGSDYSTHVGYLRDGLHVNSSHVNDYQSVAAFSPREGGLPPFRIFDLDSPAASIGAIEEDYDSLVQNLRLIKRSGLNCWVQQNKKWSEAALGEDEEGNVLLMFCRSPYSMHDLNAALLQLPIGLVAAQHLEGGCVSTVLGTMS